MPQPPSEVHHKANARSQLTPEAALADLGIDLPPGAYGEVSTLCPVCSLEHSNRKRTLSVRLERDGFVYYCHRCQWKGSHRSKHNAPVPKPRTVTPPVTNPTDRLSKLKSLWQAAYPLGHSEAEPARAYLRYRGLGAVLNTPPNDLRLHLALDYWEPGTAGQWLKLGEFPALLAVVRDVDSRPVALHRTYLQEDGCGKADVPSPKKLSTPVCPGAGTSAAVRLYPWTGDTLYVAEGVETSLAIRLIRPGEAVWSCVSAGNLARFKCPPEVERVTICCDHDSNGTGRRAGRTLAERLVTKEHKRVTLTMPSGNGDWLDVLTSGRAA